MKNMGLVDYLENILIHFHQMPYDIEIENDVNVIAI